MVAYFTFNLHYASFDISVTGLKPTTNHRFFLNDRNFTDVCEQDGGTLGGGLISDAEGVLEFVAHVPETIVYNLFADLGLPALADNFYKWPARVESPDGKSKAEITVRGELFEEYGAGPGDDDGGSFGG